MDFFFCILILKCPDFSFGNMKLRDLDIQIGGGGGGGSENKKRKSHQRANVTTRLYFTGFLCKSRLWIAGHFPLHSDRLRASDRLLQGLNLKGWVFSSLVFQSYLTTNLIHCLVVCVTFGSPDVQVRKNMWWCNSDFRLLQLTVAVQFSAAKLGRLKTEQQEI